MKRIRRHDLAFGAFVEIRPYGLNDLPNGDYCAGVTWRYLVLIVLIPLVYL